MTESSVKKLRENRFKMNKARPIYLTQRQSVVSSKSNSSSSSSSSSYSPLNELEIVNLDHDYLKPQCSLCLKFFKNSESLRCHLKSIHRETKPNCPPKLKCAVSGCLARLHSNDSYFVHLKTNHNVDVQIHEMTFPNEKEYRNWMDHVNDNYNVRFNINRKKLSKIQQSVEYFSCECNGFLKSNKKLQTNGAKLRESKKVNGRCPASIRVERCRNYLNETIFQVRYISTHVGHTPERINKDEEDLKDNLEKNIDQLSSTKTIEDDLVSDQSSNLPILDSEDMDEDDTKVNEIPDSDQIEKARKDWNEVFERMMKSREGYEYQRRLIVQMNIELDLIDCYNQNKRSNGNNGGL